MEDLYSFDNIPGTPAWYYKKFPGFYNVECYKILARWNGGVPNPDYTTPMDEKLPSPPPSDQNKKRVRECEEENNHDGDTSVR